MHKLTNFALSFLLGFSFATPVIGNNHEPVIDGAKKEGSLVLCTSMTVDQAQKLNDALRAKYPFLQVHMFRAVGERLLTKIMTETQAGRFDFDVVQSAETQAYFLKKRNLLAKYLSPETKQVQKASLTQTGFGRRST
jgi:iron(III) transport system substrate-binding protein